MGCFGHGSSDGWWWMIMHDDGWWMMMYIKWSMIDEQLDEQLDAWWSFTKADASCKSCLIMVVDTWLGWLTSRFQWLMAMFDGYWSNANGCQATTKNKNGSIPIQGDVFFMTLSRCPKWTSCHFALYLRYPTCAGKSTTNHPNVWDLLGSNGSNQKQRDRPSGKKQVPGISRVCLHMMHPRNSLSLDSERSVWNSWVSPSGIPPVSQQIGSIWPLPTRFATGCN